MFVKCVLPMFDPWCEKFTPSLPKREKNEKKGEKREEER